MDQQLGNTTALTTDRTTAAQRAGWKVVPQSTRLHVDMDLDTALSLLQRHHDEPVFVVILDCTGRVATVDRMDSEVLTFYLRAAAIDKRVEEGVSTKDN